MKQTLFLILTITCLKANCQHLDLNINGDSLLQVRTMRLPAISKNAIIDMYNSGDRELKEMILILMAMPISSKAELIKNIDSNYENINNLKIEYQKLIPTNFTVSIEIEPKNKLLHTEEIVNVTVVKEEGDKISTFRKRSLKDSSNELKEILQVADINYDSFLKIKRLLNAAKCVSIENGEITTIGFARSGLSMYSFKLFENDLSPSEIKKYNSHCSYIFYKKNIVLQYAGGATTSNCFPSYDK